MNLINKLERKFGHLGISHLMKYVIAINIVGNIIGLVNSDFYYRFLSLDIYQVLHGQVWRVLTFVLYPSLSFGSTFLIDLIWFVIWVSCYYFIGTNLERLWGTFRFNLYYFSGVFFVILATFITYFVLVGTSGLDGELAAALIEQGVTLEYLNQSLFLAFAAMFPDVQFLMYMVIPVKAKWISIIYLVFNGYQLISCLMGGYYYTAALIFGALLNFAIFFFFGRNKQAVYKKPRRVKTERVKVRENVLKSNHVHKCAICGRTELDNPQLEFRYCTKCEGDYEYCSDHLFTHEHVRK